MIFELKKAKNRVCLVSMIIVDDSSTNDFIEALIETAKRGVKVSVAADIFTYSELGGLFRPSFYFSKRVQAATLLSKKLLKNKVDFYWLGRYNITTFVGRTHSKWCVIDNNVYSFGGVNLYQMGIENNDYMIKMTDRVLASTLCDEAKSIINADKNRYAKISHIIETKYGKVLIDGGLAGDSVIYRHACKLAAEAKSAILISQYCPTGKLSKLLKKINAKTYFNTTEQATSFNKLLIYFGMKLSGQKTGYHSKQYLHAKLILFTLEDGSKVAITGSHNFTYSGVLFGTREIALETNNKKIISELESFYKDHIL
jgi:cardiolipin synthase